MAHREDGILLLVIYQIICQLETTIPVLTTAMEVLEEEALTVCGRWWRRRLFRWRFSGIWWISVDIAGGGGGGSFQLVGYNRRDSTTLDIIE